MEYEVYRHKEATDADFQHIDSVFKRILNEDKWLCNEAQRNLGRGVFVNGEMHPKMEQGPLYLQGRIRDYLFKHRKQEEEAEREIWPARQVLPATAEITNADEDFCRSLDCQAGQEEIAW